MVERFAREKTLKPLRTYLARDGGGHRGDEMLAHMRAMKKKGRDVTIRKLER